MLVFTSLAFGQTDSTTERSNALKVYLDCNFCDEQYIKDNLTFVNYVRDPHDAEIYIFILNEMAGSGGQLYTLIFSGQHKFAGRNDTLHFSTNANNTSDEIRFKLNHYLSLGLAQYVVHSPLAENIEIKYNEPNSNKNNIVKDKWNSWVFSLRASGYFTKESSYSRSYISNSLSIDKVTPDWKVNLYAGNSFNTSKYILSETDTVISNINSNYFSGLLVKSLNDHWSVGGKLNVGQSTYSNYDLYIRLKPGIEYDLFPYSESAVRQMRFLYTIGAVQNYYTDTTIYNKKQELLFEQELQIAYSVKKKWGSINLSLSGSNYLHDFTKNSLNVNTSISYRIIKGLSLSLTGGASMIHDQLNLPKGGATVEEVLLRQTQIATQYSYNAYISISYTFGSIFNNVVNPRFNSSGGTTYYFF